MRRVRYSVAMSLDGYIADPQGGYDWIVTDPDVDFRARFAAFDTALLGRKTYEETLRQRQAPALGMKTFVFSKTLRQSDCPGVTLSADPVETVAALKGAGGKDIWLFGGGSLFRSLLDSHLVDAVEVAIIPVLLGGGVPLLPNPTTVAKLRLDKHRIYPKTGTVSLEYSVV